MSKAFRPLLSATVDDTTLYGLRFPLIASPKVDGIRIVCHPSLGPVTRSLKPVRNEHIRKTLEQPEFSGLDGEIVVGSITAKDVFAQTTSGVMTSTGTPAFMYHVFDDITYPDAPYYERLGSVGVRTKNMPYVNALEYLPVVNINDIIDCEVMWLTAGFEGIMLRSPHAHYKLGRSTLKEQYLIKLKRFADAEAEIIGFEPLYTNTNPQTRSLLGLAERSDHKAGKVAVDTLGRLLVRCLGTAGQQGFGDFAVGSGFSAEQRAEIWQNQDKYLGRTITFKYQEVGIVDKPRFPIWKGFRGDE